MKDDHQRNHPDNKRPASTLVWDPLVRFGLLPGHEDTGVRFGHYILLYAVENRTDAATQLIFALEKAALCHHAVKGRAEGGESHLHLGFFQLGLGHLNFRPGADTSGSSRGGWWRSCRERRTET